MFQFITSAWNSGPTHLLEPATRKTLCGINPRGRGWTKTKILGAYICARCEASLNKKGFTVESIAKEEK